MDEGDGPSSEGDICHRRSKCFEKSFLVEFSLHLRFFDVLFVLLAELMEDYPQVPASIAERYKVGRMIGDGNFAVVRECVERSTGREYALKIINKSKCRGKVTLPLNNPSLLLFLLCFLIKFKQEPMY